MDLNTTADATANETTDAHDTVLVEGSPSVAHSHSVKVLLPYLAILATLYTFYLAQTILIPFVIALFIALFSTRLVDILERIRIPRVLGALVVVIAMIAGLTAVVLMLTLPAMDWWQRIPEVVSTVADTVDEATDSIGDIVEDAEDTAAIAVV